MRVSFFLIIVSSFAKIYSQESQVNNEYLGELIENLVEPRDSIELRIKFWNDNLWERANLVELRTLALYLDIHPNYQIVIEHHTDCRGKKSYNQALSEYRANEIRRKLIIEGIPSERIFSQGKGESNPRFNCRCDKCSEEEHSINRRTIVRLAEK